MKKYIASKGDFNVHFGFNAEGLLVAMQLPEDLTEASQLWLMRNMPICEEDLKHFAKLSKMVVSEQITEITFDDFYKQYAVKEARQKAEKSWERLSKAERIKAFKYIPVLRSKCNLSGIAMPYPATYLNNKRWND